MDTSKMREQFEAWALRAEAHGEHFDLARGNHGAQDQAGALREAQLIWPECEVVAC